MDKSRANNIFYLSLSLVNHVEVWTEGDVIFVSDLVPELRLGLQTYLHQETGRPSQAKAAPRGISWLSQTPAVIARVHSFGSSHRGQHFPPLSYRPCAYISPG